MSRDYNPPLVDRVWLAAYYSQIPIYPIFDLLNGDYILKTLSLSKVIKGLCMDEIPLFPTSHQEVRVRVEASGFLGFRV